MKRVIAALGWLLCGGAIAFAQATDSLDSANQIAPSCRAFLARTSGSFGDGICLGSVRAVAVLDHLAGIVCAPQGAQTDQAVRVIVAYIDSRPARAQEPFVTLAREALREAWPCL